MNAMNRIMKLPESGIPEGDARHAMQAGVGVLLEAGLSILAMTLHQRVC